MNRTIRYSFLLMVFLFIPASVRAVTETVRIPLTLDYAVIRSLFQEHAFNKPGGKIVIGDIKGEGCNDIELWDMDFLPEKSLLNISTRIKIKAGFKAFGKCVKFAEWEGSLKMLHRVWVDQNARQVRFTNLSLSIFDKEGKPASLGEKERNVIRTMVVPYFDDKRIDLALPVNELKNLLPFFVSSEIRPRLENWLNTLRFGDIRMDDDAVRLELLMETELPLPEQKETVPAALSPQEIELLSRSWEAWDSFLVYQIETLLGQSLTETEQTDLLETLINTRLEFIRSLSDNTLDNSLIREQFVRNWKQLEKIFRNRLATQPSTSPLKYFSFVTASDALVALDKLGPALGMDISRDGLVRLAKLLSKKKAEPKLDYSYDVNPELRKLLGFGPPLDTTGPAFDKEEMDFPEDSARAGAQDDFSSGLNFFLSTAFAAEAQPAGLADIKQWVPSAQNIQPYLSQVKQVLDLAAQDTLSRNSVENQYQDFYRLLVLSTAWQESCWRQFVTSKGKLRYLVSYNQSSTGLMQINERVWRGIYKLESLRWNIHYNARAGCEILNHYLCKYALKKMDPAKPLDPDTLGRVVYAMYNGGPGEFKKFLKRKEKNSFYDSDKLFWDKYTMAKEGQFDKVSVCILGK